MGVSTCSQHCDRVASDTITCARTLPAGHCDELGGKEVPRCEQIVGLSYTPPPPWEAEYATRAMLGTSLPDKPVRLSTGLYGSSPVSGSQFATGGKSYGRPGEPVNKVFVQYSNDLEGFLPYTLVISEENGLEFFSLSSHPDFVVDPLNILDVGLLDYDQLREDVFFGSLARSIRARVDLQVQDAEVVFEERIQPPYRPLVKLSIRRTALEGGQVLAFISVQTDHLASELVRGIKQLRRRKRHGVAHMYRSGGGYGDEATFGDGSTFRSVGSCGGVASRGCPSPRTVASTGRGAVACETGEL